MNPTLTCHGAAGTVTGSRHLLEAAGRLLLVDCGLFQGLKALRLRNWEPPPFSAAGVDDVVLTHAHLDHTGYLPRLVACGFRGAVHCTPATRELSELLLLDAARLQMEDADYANRQGFSKHRPALPLFDEGDARRALSLMRPLPFGQWRPLAGGRRFRFLPAGHLLGAALVELRLPAAGGREMTLVFSGDLGRANATLHAPPAPRPPCDLLVIESTYGDRRHDQTPIAEQIHDAFRETFARRGVVLVPSFAIGRAQQLILILRELMDAGELPAAPIHVDSPMAAAATRIYGEHLDEGDQDEGLDAEARGRLPGRKVKFHRTVAESKHLNDLPGPRVIVAGSGMLAGGRILHHLARKLPEPDHLVVLTGYQADGTRGRALLEGATALRIHGRDVPVRARVLSLHGLSGHADADELSRWAGGGATRPRAVIVTHGEPPAAAALAARLERELGSAVRVAALGETHDLDARA